MNYKKITIVLFTLSFIMFLIGSTFAYWTWESTNAQKTLVTFTITDNVTCSADGGGNIVGTKIAPAPCTDQEYAIQRRIDTFTTSSDDRVIKMDLWLDIDNISTGFLNSNNFKYAITTTAGSCTDGVITSGVFKNSISSNKVTLLNHEDEFIGTDSKTYWLYIWLDEEESDPATMNQTFKASINGNCFETGEFITKKYANLGWAGEYYKASAYKDKITSVSIVNEINVPSGATSWNLGTSPSNATDVIGWLEDDGSGNGTFNLKIGSNGGKIYPTHLSGVFSNMEKLSNINLSGFNTSLVSRMESTFYLTGTNVSDMTINLGNEFYTKNALNMTAMFQQTGKNATNLNINLGEHFDTSNVTNMATMFQWYGFSVNDFNLNLGNNFNTSKVTNMSSMFYQVGKAATNVEINLGNKFDTSNVTNMASLFGDAFSVADNVSLNLGKHFNTSKVTNMYQMFWAMGCNATNVNLNLGKHFDTSNVTQMARMFFQLGRKDSNFNLNLGNHFDTSKVTNMSQMFYETGTLSSSYNLNLGNNFNTSNVTNMSQMFFGVGKVANDFSLYLGNEFDTSKVTNMNLTFWYAGSSANHFTIYLGNKLDMSNVTDAYQTFVSVGRRSQDDFILDLSAGNFNKITESNKMITSFYGKKPTIYVKDATSKQWITDHISEWGANFTAENVLIK